LGIPHKLSRFRLQHSVRHTIRPLMVDVVPRPLIDRLVGAASHLLTAGATALANRDPAGSAALQETTRQQGASMCELQQACLVASQHLCGPQRSAISHSLEDLQMIAWLLHRLVKMLGASVADNDAAMDRDANLEKGTLTENAVE